MVILLIEKVIDNKMFPKSTAGLYISDSYQRNFISHRHRIFYGLSLTVDNLVLLIIYMQLFLKCLKALELLYKLILS